MRKQFMAVLAAGALALSACGDDEAATPAGTDSSGDASGGTTEEVDGKVGVILPDTASSARWETQDRPLLQQAFDDAGVESDIQNAGGDKAKFQTIADGMIASGVNVLIIVNLDSETGAAVIKKATDVGIPVIDYDRLTLGGGAQYYVSFDNVKVGETIGEGLVSCLQAANITSGGIVELNGSPTDNNATLFKEGYDKVIKAAGYEVVADQAVPDWNNTQGGVIFEQILTAQSGNIVGVAAANDGLGGAVVSVLERNGLAGTIPVSGQDATVEGLQRILLGTQCNTVQKSAQLEAPAVAELAVLLIQGDTAGADAAASGTVTDTESGADVKSVLLEPVGITIDNVADVVTSGDTTAEAICTTPELQTACTENGVS